MTDLERFVTAMDGEWRVSQYTLTESGRLRVHYVSLLNPLLEWTHTPFNDFGEIPPVGTVGRIGFIANKETL